jgi:two-component system CheB/CheR fusion protein
MNAMREQYEAASEEMMATNEELQSVNEEYRTALEELETSKEELQSLNEELETVNTELEHRLEELSLAHNDLQNLIAATEIATLFLDLDLHIYRFTPHLADLFSVTQSDLGRPISDFTHRLDYDRLEADARQVLEQLMHLEREVKSQDGRWYLIRFRPYRTVNNKIAGVVITLVDITERKRAEEEIQSARIYAEHIVETVHEALVILNPDLRVKSANAAFYGKFRVRPEQTEGRLIYELGSHEWNIPELRVLLEAVLPENNAFTDYEVSHNFQTIGERVMLLNGRRLDHVQHILLAIEDVTERRQAELLLRQITSRLTLAEQAERRRISQILHDDLQQLLYGIQLKIGFINHSLETGERQQLQTQAEQTITLIDDAIMTIRQLTVDLSPPVLPHEGLADALDWLVVQMKELHGLQVQLEAEQNFPLADDSLRVLLFQIIRELLFNVVKHAETDRARVTLRQEAGHLVIGVSDNGRGFEVETAGPGREHGFGFRSMRERLDLVGGRMEIASQPGRGTQVTVYAPLILAEKS